MSADKARTSGLALAWTAVLAACVIAWLGASDIPVTENTGNGCGRWNSAELSQYREQLAAVRVHHARAVDANAVDLDVLTTV